MTTASPGPVSTLLPTPQASPAWLDSATVDPAAWLKTSEIPLGATYHWSQWYSLLAPGSGAFFTSEGEPCDGPSLDKLGAYAVAGQDAHDTLADGAPRHSMASPTQQIFVFRDASTAQGAFVAVMSAAKKCQLASGTNKSAPGVHQTSGDTHSASWVSYPQAGGMVLMENHDYAVQQGRTITFFNMAVQESSAKPDLGYQSLDDRKIISALETHLSIFGTN